jgi:hypothetical protein
MGLEQLEWHDDRCDERPYPPFAHYWVEVGELDRGSVFMCKFCHRLRWYPRSFGEAQWFDRLIGRFGADEAYRLVLSNHPSAADKIVRLNDLRNIRKIITDDEQFRRIVVITTERKDYLNDSGDV